MQNPYDFSSGVELLNLTKKYKLSIAEVVTQRELYKKHKTEKEIRDKMHQRLEIVRDSISYGLKIEKRSKSGLSGGDAKKLNEYNGQKLSGDLVFKAITYSFAIMEANAASYRIVAFPTAGASGLVPASIIAASEYLGLNDDKIVDAFLASSAIGLIIALNATLAGAMGGCQSEVGSASSMAAAALVELRSGSPEQALHAASISLKGLLGLVCDPIAGLVECPCVKRNSTGLTNAFMAQDIAMAGIKSNIPFDEVVSALKEIGETMSENHKETARGGVAICRTGLKVNKKMFGK